MWVKITPFKAINMNEIASFEKHDEKHDDSFSSDTVYGICFAWARSRTIFTQRYSSEDTRDAYFDSIYRQLNNPETF